MATNRIHTIGRLTADPELKEVSGVPCLNFTLASDTRNKDASGNATTNFYRVTAWRKPAEILTRYLHKGDKVYIEGDLVIRTYKDNNGVDRTSVGINLTDFEFVDNRRARHDDADSAVKPETFPKTEADDSDDPPF